MVNQAWRKKPDQSVVFCISIRFLKVGATFKCVWCFLNGMGSGLAAPSVALTPVLLLSVRRKLLSVLDTIEFSQDIPELLQLDFFERTQIEQVISNCEHVNEQGHTVCNVKVGFKSYLFSWGGGGGVFLFAEVSWFAFFCPKLLHRVLVAEVNALQGMAAIGQRPLLMEVSEPSLILVTTHRR